MRISDWSSDVCSSDLLEAQLGAIWHADLDDMLRIADIVSINAPHTEQTQHLIDARRLALLGSHAYLINTARGEIIDEAALIEALEHGRLAGDRKSTRLNSSH